LLRRLTVKKRMMLGSQRARGMARGLRKKGGWAAEKWAGKVKREVRRNWMKVMRRPGGVSCIVWTVQKELVVVYHSEVLLCVHIVSKIKEAEDVLP
jgi:hypothetical protein